MLIKLRCTHANTCMKSYASKPGQIDMRHRMCAAEVQSLLMLLEASEFFFVLQKSTVSTGPPGGI